MSGLQGYDRTPRADVRARRNSQRLSSNFTQMLGSGFEVDAGGLITIDVQNPIFVDNSGVGLNYSTGLQLSGSNLVTKDSEIVHDDLAGFEAAEHIDWTNASVSFLTTGSVTIDSDSNGIIFGGAQDASMYFDGSDLQIFPEATGDVELFSETDVADDAMGRKFYIWRKAAEGDKKIYMYLDTYGSAHLNTDASIFYMGAANSAAGYWGSTGFGFLNNKNLSIGGISATFMTIGLSTYQTPNAPLIKLSEGVRVLILCDKLDYSYDFAHAAQPTPTFFFQSDAQSATEWGSITHDGTDFTFNAGTGKFKIIPQLNATAGMNTKVSTDNVSDPPTAAELNTAFGTPATLGAGFIGVLDDNSDNTDVWLCYTSDTSWFYLQGTKAA